MTCLVRLSQDTFWLDHTKSLVDVTTLCLDVTISTVRIDWPPTSKGMGSMLKLFMFEHAILVVELVPSGTTTAETTRQVGVSLLTLRQVD
jgi:hypothetical protein